MEDGFALCNEKNRVIFYHNNDVFFYDISEGVLYYNNHVYPHIYMSPNYIIMVKPLRYYYELYSLESFRDGMLKFRPYDEILLSRTSGYQITYGVYGIFVHYEGEVYYITPHGSSLRYTVFHDNEEYGFLKPLYFGYSYISTGRLFMFSDNEPTYRALESTDVSFTINGESYRVKYDEPYFYLLDSKSRIIHKLAGNPRFYYIEKKALLIDNEKAIAVIDKTGSRKFNFYVPRHVNPCLRLQFLDRIPRI